MQPLIVERTDLFCAFWRRTAYQLKHAPDGTSWIEESQALTSMCPLVPTYAKLACLTRVDSTIKGGVLNIGPSVSVLRPNDPTSMAEVQTLVANAMGGPASYGTWQLGAGFYDTIQKELNFDNRYRRVYVVNPAISWSNDLMNKAQPGATSFTVCTKIVATALITISTPGGQQYRRLLSVTSTPDWYTPEARKQVRSALSRPVIAPRPRKQLRKLLQTADQVASPTAAQAGTTIGIDRSGVGITAASTVCLAVFGSMPTQCAMFLTQEMLSASAAEALCAAEQAGTESLSMALQERWSTTLQPYMANVDHGVVANYKLSGCPQQLQSGRRMLGFDKSALSVQLLLTVLAHLDVSKSKITVNMVTITKNAQQENGTIELQWDISGGGAAVTIDTITYSVPINSTNITLIDCHETKVNHSTPSPVRGRSVEEYFYSSAASLVPVVVNILLACSLGIVFVF